jgi:hypothetical protein
MQSALKGGWSCIPGKVSRNLLGTRSVESRGVVYVVLNALLTTTLIWMYKVQ